MEEDITATSPEQSKALVLEAFDTLFNARDYVAAERFWSERYIRHSAHVPPGRDACSISFAAFPTRCATKIM
jgi:predicted SnoaL-like aldol condensation-catalyzing enzyme